MCANLTSCQKDNFSTLDGTYWINKLDESYILPVGEDNTKEHYRLLIFEGNTFTMFMLDNNQMPISYLRSGTYTSKKNKYYLVGENSYHSMFELDDNGYVMHAQSGTYYKLPKGWL